MKRNGDTQGVPADLVFRDQASLCTGDVLPGGFSLSFQIHITTVNIAQYSGSQTYS